MIGRSMGVGWQRARRAGEVGVGDEEWRSAGGASASGEERVKTDLLRRDYGGGVFGGYGYVLWPVGFLVPFHGAAELEHQK